MVPVSSAFLAHLYNPLLLVGLFCLSLSMAALPAAPGTCSRALCMQPFILALGSVLYSCCFTGRLLPRTTVFRVNWCCCFSSNCHHCLSIPSSVKWKIFCGHILTVSCAEARWALPVETLRPAQRQKDFVRSTRGSRLKGVDYAHNLFPHSGDEHPMFTVMEEPDRSGSLAAFCCIM